MKYVMLLSCMLTVCVGCKLFIEEKTEFTIDEVTLEDGILIDKASKKPVTGEVRSVTPNHIIREGSIH